MPQPTQSDVHVDRPLTSLSVAYMQDATKFIAPVVFPMVPVAKKSDQYWVYDRENWMRSEAKERAPGTESAGGGWTMSTDSYLAKKYAYHKDVDDDTRANQDEPINLDRDATQFVTYQLLLKREDLWQKKFFLAGVWATDFTPTATEEWNTAAGTPIEDVETGSLAIEEATGFMPNTLVVGPRVHSALKNHPDIIERIKYTQTGIVTNQLLAALFEVDNYLVARPVINTAAEGLAESNSFIYGKHALLCYAAPSPGLMQPSAGYTFAWTGLLGSGAFGNRILSFRMDEIQSDRVEAEQAFDLKVIGADLGYFFEDVVT